MLNRRFRIAIIGGGASGVMLFHNVIHLLKEHQPVSPISIFIYEPNEIGSGIAFQKDVATSLLNVRAKAMNIATTPIGSFVDWCRRFEETSHVEPHDYVPRFLFGRYLKAVFDVDCEHAKAQGIEIIHIKEKVVEIERTTGYQVRTTSGHHQSIDVVNLCIGGGVSKDVFSLGGSLRYIHDPYPIHRYLPHMQDNARVAILGSSLTAIDVAIALLETRPVTVCMYSKNGKLPSVRGIIEDYEMKLMNQDYLKQASKKEAGMTLRSAYHVIKQEFSILGEDADKIFRKSIKQKFTIDMLEKEIEDAQKVSKWQGFMIATNDCIEYYWDKLNPVHKRLFIKRYHSLWMARRCPMPVANAKKIRDYLLSGRLKIESDIERVENQKTHYEIHSHASASHYDWVINATGLSRQLEKCEKNTLVYDLLKKGFVVENPFGGLSVDFETSRAINRDKNCERMMILGHLTNGVHYYTNSFVMISKRAKKIASQLMQLIENCHEF